MDMSTVFTASITELTLLQQINDCLEGSVIRVKGCFQCEEIETVYTMERSVASENDPNRRKGLTVTGLEPAIS